MPKADEPAGKRPEDPPERGAAAAMPSAGGAPEAGNPPQARKKIPTKKAGREGAGVKAYRYIARIFLSMASKAFGRAASTDTLSPA